MSYKVAPLTVNPAQKSSLISKAFVSQPSAEEEQLVGRLFVLMEIDQSKNDDFALADFIVKDIYHHYYENEQFFLRDKIANLKIDYIFEAALTKLNRGIAEFLETKKMNFRPGGLSIVIGVLHKNRLLFTETGTSKAFLLYQPKVKTGQRLSEYNLMDISEKTEDPTQEISNTNKLFANVINGSIPTGGYFLFANEAVLEYLSKKQLTEIITTLPPTSAVEQMKIILEQTKAFVPFFALIVKNTLGEEKTSEYAHPTSPVPTNPETMGGGRTSVDQFNNTQERTEELLSPSGMLTMKKWLAKLHPASSTLKNYAQDTARKINLSDNSLKAKGSILSFGKKILQTLQIIFSLLLDAGKKLLSFATDADVRQTTTTSIKTSGKKLLMAFRNLFINIQNLSAKQKALLAFIVICLILFLGNLTYSAISSKKQAEAARVAEARTAFEQKEHQLEASLLYNNLDGAKQILKEMDDIIKSLPVNTETEKEAVATLTNTFHERSDKIFAIVRLDNPSVWVELPAESDSVTLTNSELFATNGKEKNIYQINSDKKINTINSGEFSGNIITALSDEADTYFWDSTNLFSFTPLDSSIKKMTIENRPENISTIAVYNTRLYLGSLADKTIYRFNQDKRSLSFSNRQEWLRSKFAYTDLTTMAVNGNIYTIADQKIQSYRGGADDSLVLEETTPELTKPDNLTISQDQKWLFILDSENQRVVVYSNDGSYKTQFTASAFNNLKDLAITQDNKKLYLLNGNSIYEIAINL